MGETMQGRPNAGAAMAGDPAQAGRLIERASELLAAVRDCGEAAGDLMPNTTDEDRARAVLQGQAALCDTVQALLQRAGEQLADLAHRQRVIQDAQRALRNGATPEGRAAT
jgi:hypothetical protein